ncbi:MAG TPA: hypothetical protein VG735_13645 [Caulobacterales bacterium]|nr:hypothetical protein [Caulobacterales bacterium]
MALDESIFLEAAHKLKESAQLGRSFESAQVKVIGLDDIKRAAGDDWAAIGNRIRANSLRFLQGCLGKDDLVIPAGDGFLVLYAQLPGRDFESETATMQDSLNGFYLGDEATKLLKADIKHTRINSRSLVHLIGNADGPESTAPPDATRHEFSFVPIWGAKEEAVMGYWIAPVYRSGDGKTYGYDRAWAQSGVSSGHDYLSLDLAILGRAVQEAERSLASGRRCLLAYSVHATTLQQRSRRREYLSHLYTTPESLRPYLLGRISEIEPGTPTVTMAEWVHQLRPVTRRVTIQLHETDRAITGLDSTGAFKVSLTLSSAQHGAAVQEAYARLIPRWARALRPQKIQFRLDNVLDPTLMAVAISSGVDFLTSERFWPVETTPKGVRLYSRGQLQQALGIAA